MSLTLGHYFQIQSKVETTQQQQQNEQHDLYAHSWVFSLSDQVYARTFSLGLVADRSSVIAIVKLTDGQVIK